MKSVVVPAVIAGLVAFATPAHADDTPPPVLVDAVADCHHLTYTVSNLLADDMVIEEFGSAPPGNIRPDANGVASLEQPAREVGADEPGSSGDEDLHAG